MKGDLRTRKVRTSSGATAVQIIRYETGKRTIVRHIGSAHTDEELTALYREAEIVKEELSKQLSLFSITEKDKATSCL